MYTVWGYLCWVTGQEGIKTNNYYTINHMNYNISIFTLGTQGLICIMIGILSQGNFGLRTRIKCIDYSLTFILICLRICLILFYFFVLVPKACKIVNYTWKFNKINTWQDPDNEPFFTNCSLFNAFTCWYLYCAYMFLIYILMIYLPLIFIFIIITFI